ncbi:hypothetical protein BGW36DRAFT_331195 [Talaromyces proteolyticus]|uniref:Nucleoporin NUP37 n=1 Tax=Talaromyces proteolyticus TaxID=1131652 RepID=A0AAD4KDY9_9EURO|nr:uncharacterized protein BGW36DRAFT_331195 [Talaromyces proteolyticus]KAH8688754.1 hypothetical protein BGW36DRAFT_331195 [Talaromyces proteolyticus]
MTSSFATPIVRQRDDGLQLSYSLPHRVFTAKPYPLLAPNGSTIIVYGHDDGIRIIWRGGQPFLPSPIEKKQEASVTTRKPNNVQNIDESIMIIDSDDEEPAPATSHTHEAPQVDIFEDEETEIDPSHPYEPIIYHVDIPLGSKALQLAVPSVLPEKARSLGYTVPPILTKLIVVSVICADSKLRVITFPLAPPHPKTAKLGPKPQTITLDATVSHNEIPNGASMTFTCGKDEKESTRHTRSRPGSSQPVDTNWDLLVATHTAEASGTLLVYSIPIRRDTEDLYTIAISDIRPIQTHHLPSPAKAISFNPSPYPSARHSHLLVSFSDGYVKILECLEASKGTRNQNEDERLGPSGKWLLTLYVGFESAANVLGRRKTIVDAAWALFGKAIIVLLADGEWGVWDVEGAGPGSEPGPLVGQTSVRGVTGGSLTAFSISGRIVGSPQASKSQSTSNSVSEQRSKFAPMTPSTRRIREDTLFRGAQTPTPPSLHGEIAIIQTNSWRATLAEEAVLIRHGEQIAIIPSLLSLWRSAAKASGTFDASIRSRVSTLGNVNFLGERLTGVAHLPSAVRTGRNKDQQEYEIFITAEHRFIILAPKLAESTPHAGEH